MADLAHRIGISVSTISRVELGQRDTPTSRFEKWVEVCQHKVVVVDERWPQFDLLPLAPNEVVMFERLIRAWPTLSKEVQQGLIVQFELWCGSVLPATTPTWADQAKVNE